MTTDEKTCGEVIRADWGFGDGVEDCVCGLPEGHTGGHAATMDILDWGLRRSWQRAFEHHARYGW